MTGRLSGATVPMFLLFITCGSSLLEGLPSTEEQQLSAIVKRLESRVERQDAVINELYSKNEALGRELKTQNSKLVERIETKETSMAIRDKELLHALEDKAVRDLPFIMMCAYQGHWTDTGIIAYDELTLDYTNCDRPGGGCSSMDIASGTFTAETGGLYTVTFSGTADLHAHEAVKLHLLHNSSRVKGSNTDSFSSGDSGYMAETFSRTVVSIIISTIGALSIGPSHPIHTTRED